MKPFRFAGSSSQHWKPTTRVASAPEIAAAFRGPGAEHALVVAQEQAQMSLVQRAKRWYSGRTAAGQAVAPPTDVTTIFGKGVR